MRRVSHKPRTMALYRDAGYLVADVEARRPAHKPGGMPIPGGRTHDAFGLGDLLVAHPATGPVLVQVCSASTLAAHRRKAQQTPELPRLLICGLGFMLCFWDKTPGGRWRARIEQVFLGPDTGPELIPTRLEGFWARRGNCWEWNPNSEWED